METLTVPKKMTKGEDLIIIPKKEYEEFLNFRKQKMPAGQTLDQELDEALEDVRQGKVMGPFSNVEQGLKALKNSK